MKRTFLFTRVREPLLLGCATALVAGTYGLVRLAYGLFLPDVRETLAMSAAAAGQISSAASLVYCVGALVALPGRGPRWLVVGATAAAAVGAGVMAAAPSLPVFAGAAVVSSAGAGIASPALVVVLARNVAEQRLDRAQSLVNAGTGPGLVGAGLLALAVLPHWRAGLWVSAAVTGAAGLGVLLLDSGERGPGRPAASSPPLLALRRPGLAALLLGAGSAVVWVYGRDHLVAQGASPTASTIAWIALGLGGTLSACTAGVMTRRTPRQAWVVSVAAAGAGAAALGLGAGVLPAALAACALFGWGFVAATSALIAWAASLHPAGAAAGTAALFVVLVLGQALGAAVAGPAVGSGHRVAAFVVAALVSGLGAVPALPGRRFAGPAGRSSAGRLGVGLRRTV